MNSFPKKDNAQNGSVIILILVAVALFSALSWAWMENSRSNISLLTSEKSKSVVTASQDCQNAIDAATKRLESRGCGSFITTNADGSLAGVPGEPTDGSCALYHPNGGGIKYCVP